MPTFKTKVLDGDTDKPLKDATVLIQWTRPGAPLTESLSVQGKTNSLGEIELSVPSGEGRTNYKIKVEKKGYSLFKGTPNFFSDPMTPSKVWLYKRAAAVDQVYWVREEVFTKWVGVKGLTVRITGGPGAGVNIERKTGDTGRFHLSLANGTYKFVFIKEGYHKVGTEVVVKNGYPSPVTFEVRKKFPGD